MAFNSREYEWADVTLIVGGVDAIGIRSVKWSRKTELEAVGGKGRDPHSIQRGNNTYEVEFGMLQSEFDRIEAAMNDDILSGSVDCEVSFGNPTNGDAIKTHRCLGVRFSEDTLEMKNGDKFSEIKVPGLALKIQKNV